jgi:gamma-glutamylcyclotransferase (GGCT)/AIG2-like uncharacterized protein YtfP
LTIKESARTTPPEKNVTSRLNVEVTGKIEQENNAAGGSYLVNGGKTKSYVLAYVRDLDENTQNKLNRLVKLGVPVTVKGVLKSWSDGSLSFDNSQSAYVQLLTVKALPQGRNSTANSGRAIEVTGKVDFGTNAAGSNFFIDGGRGKQYILGYYRDLDEETQAQLGRLADSGAVVTAKGVMRSWDDGSSSFDNAQPVDLFFVVKKDQGQNQSSGDSGNHEGSAVSKLTTKTGTVEYGSNAAGGTYWIRSKGKQYTLGYVRDLDQDTQNQLSKLADSGDNVTVKGTLKTWKDGTASFDNSQAISIYKTK